MTPEEGEKLSVQQMNYEMNNNKVIVYARPFPNTEWMDNKVGLLIVWRFV